MTFSLDQTQILTGCNNRGKYDRRHIDMNSKGQENDSLGDVGVDGRISTGS